MTAYRFAIGVDPGATGGAVVLDRGGRVLLAERAIWKTNALTCAEKTVHAPPRLDRECFDRVKHGLAPADVVVAIEEPLTAHNPKFALSNRAVALSCGQWVGAFGLAGFDRIVLVQPKRWQLDLMGFIPAGQTKERALLFAQHLWGPGFLSLASTSSGKPHDGVVDAALIAEWVRQFFVLEAR